MPMTPESRPAFGANKILDAVQEAGKVATLNHAPFRQSQS